jgi:ankyrin repeat protein
MPKLGAKGRFIGYENPPYPEPPRRSSSSQTAKQTGSGSSQANYPVRRGSAQSHRDLRHSTVPASVGHSSRSDERAEQQSLDVINSFTKAIRSRDPVQVLRAATNFCAVNDVNRIVDHDDSTALHMAAEYGFVDTVDYLLRQSANVNAKTKDGATPLHEAVGDPSMIERLVTAGAEVNTATHDGTSPLHMAILMRQLQSVECLFRAGADMNAQYGTDNLLPYELALRLGENEIASRILELCVLGERDVQAQTEDLAGILRGDPHESNMDDSRPA